MDVAMDVEWDEAKKLVSRTRQFLASMNLPGLSVRHWAAAFFVAGGFLATAPAPLGSSRGMSEEMRGSTRP